MLGSEVRALFKMSELGSKAMVLATLTDKENKGFKKKL